MTIRSGEPDRVAAATWLAKTFGLGRAIELRPVARGAMGEVNRLTTSAGSYAAKRYFWDEGGLPHADFSEAFAQRCRSRGVPVPEAVRDRAGALLARDDGGRWWQLARWVPGTKPPADDRPTALWLARQTARIHAIGQRPDRDAQLDPFYASCAVDWVYLVARAHAAVVGWASELEGRAADFANLAAWATSVPSGDLVISHNDLVLNNVLVDGADRWLIDWDNVGPQDPVREMGVQLFGALAEPALVRALLDEYHAADGVEFAWGADVFASAVLIRLNYLALQIELLLDPAKSEHHDFALAQVLPALRDIPALPLLRRQAESVQLRSDV